MTTRQAFEKMINEGKVTQVIAKLKINYTTFYSYKHRLKKKEKLSEENMKKMLLKFGFKLIQEEKWSSPL